jgi:hypothetical protein
MGTCKTCGKKCDKEYCFQHKPRKPLAAKKGFNLYVPQEVIDVYENEIKKIPMHDMFMQIWKKRPHKSEISGTYLGSEALSTYFHHILPKSKYPKACLDEENIILLTWEEHDQVEMDTTRYEEVNKRREQLKQKYEIA